MAKVGEGDPRWIVNERKDGANVNAWHWEERDLSEHARECITKALTHHKFSSNIGDIQSIEIEELADFKCDVTVAQRKGRMMCYFELKFNAKWVGTLKDESKVKGKMEVPEVDHDQFMEDFDIMVSCEEKGASAMAVEEIVRTSGRKAVRDAVQAFFKKVFEDYHIGQTLKSGTAMPPPPVVTASQEKSTGNDSSKGAPNNSASGTITWTMQWGAPIEELFAALTDERRVSMYTRRPASINASKNGQFQLLAGVITGYFVDVVAPTQIKSQWRLSSWEVGVHSSVVINLKKEEPGVTLVEFAQCGIPSGQIESVKEGWKANFFDAIKVVFGYPVKYL